MLSLSKNKRKSKIKDVIIKNIPTVKYEEVLLNNAIEEYLQLVLKPLNLMQSIFICAKYSIRDNFITANRTSYNLLGLICAVIFRCLIFYNLAIYSYDWKKISIALNWCNAYDCLFFSIGFILNYCSNIRHYNNNALLVLKIQDVHRVLKIDGIHLKSFVTSNWAHVIILNWIYILGSLYCWIHFGFNNILDCMSDYSNIAFDINIIYATFVIKLLRKTLVVWIKDLQSSENPDESHWKIMFDLFLNLLEAYKIFEKTFLLLIVFYITHTVCHGLMTVAMLQMQQLMTNHRSEFALLAVLTQTWLVKSSFLQILLCIECEKFYATMTEVQSVCTLLKSSKGCSDKQRRACKNIQRQQIASFKKLNAFGFLLIDATLPFQISNVITTYTLTLLQFDLS